MAGFSPSKLNGFLKSLSALRRTRLKVGELARDLEDVREDAARARDGQERANRQLSALDARLRAETGEGLAPKTPKARILQCDDFHINDRNFRPLTDYLGSPKVHRTIGIYADTPPGALMACHGAYGAHHETLDAHRRHLERLAPEQLRDLVYKNLPVFDVAADEIFSVLLCRPELQDTVLDKQTVDRFDLCWRADRQLVIDNCAAVLYWADYWSKFSLGWYHFGVIFSGSLIYSRTLLELAKFSRMRTLVCESFFTGADFFLEERHAPIANASRIRNLNFRKSLQTRADALGPEVWRRSQVRALNKHRFPKNKNVVQPAPASLPPLLKTKKCVLILGQVANDFSIISGTARYLNTVPVYQRLIEHILQDPHAAVIFKAHPWEHKKQNLKDNLTEKALRAWAAKLTPDASRRLFICADFNLPQLFRIASHVVTLCSQGALEAAGSGFKPVVVGGAFYDSAGFTHNFATLEDFDAEFSIGSVSPRLTLDEYENFQNFMTLLLEFHLLNAEDAAPYDLQRRTRLFAAEPHAALAHSELALEKTWGAAADAAQEAAQEAAQDAAEDGPPPLAQTREAL